ncbi:hypothetical protein GLAREA_00635 [Glarea lozoyensis ATCC 20868]|uniref:Transmembrane protein n=1 Tax=Glarea lozoyensis (strain ATCC 20868 / MF5171) TaxID=1116229 RepID=S3CUZ5_GLAL2|nr:uncharacterized protein GLAREA_00635 [Glarea lozoyensis ATCC 20868]EPE29475.1 hypothetical protein GLAREA_00635 [Glarea lozoyensis ATCC 20868]
METSTSRLRKAFRYQNDSGDSDEEGEEAMDEEEQESLIRNLRTQNDTWNKTYTKILLALPLVSIIPYILALFSDTSKRPPLLSLLSITSLLSTAYLVYIFPPETTGLSFVDKQSKVVRSRQERLAQGEDGPIRRYLPILNVALCVAILGLGRLVSDKGDGGEWIILSGLPAGASVVVLLGKWVMGSVDPERELAELKYELKGA